MVKKILPLALAAAAGVLIVAAIGYFSMREQKPAPPVALPAAPAIDLAALEGKAAQGDAQAQAQLGQAFATGNGVKRDYKQAAQWYAQAASNGNLSAEAALGELYQAGQGVRRDFPRALKLFHSAADAGNVAAQYDLAFIYEQGRDVPQDHRAAAKWYRLAAEGGDALAQYDYGQRCVLGVGLAKDPVEGLKWFLIAAATGQPDAAAHARSVESSLSGAQVAEAKKRASEFIARGASK